MPSEYERKVYSIGSFIPSESVNTMEIDTQLSNIDDFILLSNDSDATDCVQGYIYGATFSAILKYGLTQTTSSYDTSTSISSSNGKITLTDAIKSFKKNVEYTWIAYGTGNPVIGYAPSTANVATVSGTNTSDATATEGDILKGQTAYVNGKKLTGTIVKAACLNNDITNDNTSNDGKVLYSEEDSKNNKPATINVTWRPESNDYIAVNSDTSIVACARPELFGDATAADVVKGKTFTSASGLKIVGTYEGGEEVSPYKNKIGGAVGDSIIAGYGWEEGTGVIQPLKERYPEATWFNNAESGANMAITSNPAHTPIVTQIKNLPETLDFVMFDGGVNDVNNGISVGSIASGYDAIFDESTFCGAFESALQYLMDNYPETVKFYIIPHSFAKDNSYVDSIYEKAIEMCNKWNMPVLDMRKYSQIAMTASNKEKYTRNPKTNKGDGVHPTEAWYRTHYSPIVDQCIRKLGLNTLNKTSENIPVTSVEISQSTLNLNVGDTVTLTASVFPSNATNKSVTWNSNNSNVSVSGGKVTAKTAGSSIVTVTTADGGYTAQCNVTISNVSVQGVSLNTNSLSLKVRSTYKLIPTITPSNATNTKVTWKSNNSNVSVSDGTVTANTKGSSIVTVTTNDGGFTDTCNIDISENIIEVTNVSLNETSLSLNVGDTYTLIATITPSSATNQTITWSADNDNVSVENGLVTANKAGSSVVTAKSVNNKYAKCNITIVEKQVETHSELTALGVDSSCYFDTGIYPDQDTNTEIKVRIKDGTTYIAGARDSNYKFGCSCTDNFYSVRGTVTSAAKPSNYWADLWTIKQNGANVSYTSYNNVYNVTTDPIDSFKLTSPYYIGTMSKNGASAGTGVNGYFYYVKLYSGDTLIADIIPVKKSDGTLCLFDKVREKYMYNSGTGTLTELTTL